MSKEYRGTTLKTCSGPCGETKSPDEFHNQSSRKDGKHPHCKKCALEYAKEYYAANREAITASHKERYAANGDAIKAQQREYYAANREVIKANKKEYRAVNPTNPEVRLASRLKHKYNITPDDYDRMLEAQLGLCANPECFNEPSDCNSGRLEVDHDHTCCPGQKTCGKCIRGLLCSGCNLMLGHARDDIKRLRGLADYLEVK